MDLGTYYGVCDAKPPKGNHDVWWRADDRRYANWDPWDDEYSGSHLSIVYSCYVVERYTPKGVWLRGFMTGPIFVLGTATRQTAVPTKELALRDLVARKKKHVECAKIRWQQAEQHLAAAQKELEKLHVAVDQISGGE